MQLILPFLIKYATDYFTFSASQARLFGQLDEVRAACLPRLIFNINAERRLVTVLWSIRL
jgi:hypothetical protein